MARVVEIGEGRLSARDVADIARAGATVTLAPAAWERISAAYAVLGALIAGGAAIYGVTTGLGAAVDTRITERPASVQRRVPLARSVGVGRRADASEVRAVMAARLGGLALGRSGGSPAIVEALAALLNRGVHPVVPMTGSVGEADLPPLAHIAAVLVGEGAAEHRGEVLSGAEALSRVGMSPPELGAKDGLALVSSNAASVGLGALVIVDAEQVMRALLAATALSFEGYRAGVGPLDPRVSALRAAPRQAEAARLLLRLLRGGDLLGPTAARRLQDPLSFRCVASVYGACLAALDAARDAIDLELNSSDDNPAILAEEACALVNGNFDPTHLALAFEGLGLALARVAALSGERVMKLMSPASNDLPRFLSPIEEGRTGFATAQKTLSALVAEIQHRALPMPVVVMPVADRVEDYGTMAVSIVEKTADIVARLRLLVAIELMVASQACDLRGGIALGAGTRAVRAAVRSVVPALGEDRPAAPDIDALDALIRGGAFDAVAGEREGRP